jgi:hypothetical protein
VISLPRKLHLAIAVLFVSAALVVAYVLLTNNVPEYDSSQNVINIILKYGVGARNELNTFEGTYTKDMVADNPITIRMILSEEELGQIQQKVTEMDLFSFPDNFSINQDAVTPQTDYYIKVQNGSTVKEVSWNVNSAMESDIQNSLGQLASYLIGMIEQKPEYKALPEPTSGYC